LTSSWNIIPDLKKEDIFMSNEINDRHHRAERYITKCRLRELRRERRRNKMVLTAAKVIVIVSAVLLGVVIGGGML